MRQTAAVKSRLKSAQKITSKKRKLQESVSVVDVTSRDDDEEEEEDLGGKDVFKKVDTTRHLWIVDETGGRYGPQLLRLFDTIVSVNENRTSLLRATELSLFAELCNVHGLGLKCRYQWYSTGCHARPGQLRPTGSVEALLDALSAREARLSRTFAEYARLFGSLRGAAFDADAEYMLPSNHEWSVVYGLIRATLDGNWRAVGSVLSDCPTLRLPRISAYVRSQAQHRHGKVFTYHLPRVRMDRAPLFQWAIWRSALQRVVEMRMSTASRARLLCDLTLNMIVSYAPSRYARFRCRFGVQSLVAETLALLTVWEAWSEIAKVNEAMEVAKPWPMERTVVDNVKLAYQQCYQHLSDCLSSDDSVSSEVRARRAEKLRDATEGIPDSSSTLFVLSAMRAYEQSGNEGAEDAIFALSKSFCAQHPRMVGAVSGRLEECGMAEEAEELQDWMLSLVVRPHPSDPVWLEWAMRRMPALVEGRHVGDEGADDVIGALFSFLDHCSSRSESRAWIGLRTAALARPHLIQRHWLEGQRNEWWPRFHSSNAGLSKEGKACKKELMRILQG